MQDHQHPLGVKVEKFILFDMKQVQEIINHLGGVDITVTDAEANYLRRYAISKTSTTPSMGREQDSISLSRGEDQKLVVHGRHDPCIVPRAVPVMEAAAAAAIYDAYLCSL